MRQWHLVVLVCSLCPPMAAAQAPTTAFVHVNLIAMTGPAVARDQTVIVEGDRIVAAGSSAAVAVPAGARIIDGRDQFLLPGLTDSHAHIATDMPWAPARQDFGDGILFLASGVTTVVNLAGGPEQLDWRRRIAAGELLGPTIYSSGGFINEPRFATPDAIREEVAAQGRAGFDVIKFHELPGTTTGLSAEAYAALISAARDADLPLVGHAPTNLGWPALLRSGQPLAHLGALTNIYFLPLRENLAAMSATLISAPLLLVGLAARATRRAVCVAFASVTAAVVLLVMVLPGGPWVGSQPAHVAIVVVTFVIGLSAARIAKVASNMAPRPASVRSWLAAVLAMVTTALFAVVWIPLAWRSTPSGILRAAAEVAAAGIPVQTTLAVYESMAPGEHQRFRQDRLLQYLRPETRRLWVDMPRSVPPGYSLHTFSKRVAKALHDAGVPLIAGTDAMGIERIIPGSSLLRELELLVESGLRPIDALHTATTNAAAFVRRAGEFGMVTPGARADLLLVQRDPLADISALRDLNGVMVRGKWLSSQELGRRLAALAEP